MVARRWSRPSAPNLNSHPPPARGRPPDCVSDIREVGVVIPTVGDHDATVFADSTRPIDSSGAGSLIVGWSRSLTVRTTFHTVGTMPDSELDSLHDDGTIWAASLAPAPVGRRSPAIRERNRSWRPGLSCISYIATARSFYTGPPGTGWQMLESNPRTAAIAADEWRDPPTGPPPALYQLHNDRTIFVYTGPPKSPSNRSPEAA